MSAYVSGRPPSLKAPVSEADHVVQEGLLRLSPLLLRACGWAWGWAPSVLRLASASVHDCEGLQEGGVVRDFVEDVILGL
mmetsp:Transcript_98877/g.295285  ORF Transcript_98877/g.295285 Transcript_98877/m.295285 type:complete len:80 (+) Transcript_98877:80-319(+)